MSASWESVAKPQMPGAIISSRGYSAVVMGNLGRPHIADRRDIGSLDTQQKDIPFRAGVLRSRL